ncbi:unnamed protein product [Miscanthus lutarioriparius]|uniref:Uncharacterized protein n=1 Tax=Miscanthus lutarioriparius TaxID=422564 RepID=A0A811RXN8_9POAL|nr:unnamed protein product [Miscanthus lutarioriparius]
MVLRVLMGNPSHACDAPNPSCILDQGVHYEPSSMEEVMEIDEHIGCAMSGLIADARTLVKHARVETQVNKAWLMKLRMLWKKAETLEKDEETSQQIEKAQELAKAELAAAVAKEKASQIEQIAEATSM